MRKIILASRSKARAKLLKDIGLKFCTASSKIKEERVLKNGCSELVINNALKKARDVAKKFNSGIVIGADTVVLAGKSIIGKPKSRKDAEKTLTRLSRNPQWVYSGIAVIDIDKKKTVTFCEKTKVFMRRLKKKEIHDYFTRVSPFDKAGSFDIQGLGGLFVERIEGCFYNVVGLPLPKLALAFAEIGFNIFHGRSKNKK